MIRLRDEFIIPKRVKKIFEIVSETLKIFIIS